MDCEKKYYAIREVSEATGVKPVTLRAWQRRYNLIQPQRTEKGHRLYSDEDIETIRLVQTWLNKGVSIGKVKGLLRAENVELTTQDMVSSQLEEVEPLLTALSRLHKPQAESVIHAVIKEYPLEVVTKQFVRPAMSALRLVKRSQQSLQMSLFIGLLVSKLESIIDAENKAAHLGQCLLLNMDNDRDIDGRLWAATLSEDGWSVAILDNIDDLAGLVKFEITGLYSSIAIYSSRPIGEQQYLEIEQLKQQFDGEVLLCDLLNSGI
jgi:DNA-binding transcriptional MerR regulator